MLDLDNAEAIFLRALELKPDNQKTHFYLGNIYEKKSQYYNAIFQYRKAGANIMVRRVQEKIDLERPGSRVAEHGDATVSTPSLDDTRPPVAISEATADMGTATSGGMRGPDTLEKVNVDHIDRRRFLTALQAGLFKDNPPQDLETSSDDTSPNLEIGPPPTTRNMETEEAVRTAEDQAVIAETLDRISPDFETLPPTAAIPDSEATRLRLTEPLAPDQPLEDAAQRKIPERAGSELFSDRRHGERRESAPSTGILPARPTSLDRRVGCARPSAAHPLELRRSGEGVPRPYAYAPAGRYFPLPGEQPHGGQLLRESVHQARHDLQL